MKISIHNKALFGDVSLLRTCGTSDDCEVEDWQAESVAGTNAREDL